MSERLDPEDVRDVMSRIFGEVAQVVAGYDGHIENFMGDGVMVLFGVPRVHEDDPVRAIKAAAEIHDRVRKMGGRVEAKIGRPLAMHTGISTGLVVTGDADPGPGKESVLGDALNVASRLTGLAAEDEIVVGRGTYERTQRFFDFEPMGPTKVKGKEEDVEAYKLLSAKQKPESIHRLSGLRAELVGRTAEVAQLAEALRRLEDGQGTIVHVRGDAGTGKSRLLEEFAAGLDFERVQWLEGHCHSHSQDMPYYPLIDLLNRAWQIEEGDSPEELRDKIQSNIGELLEDDKEIAGYIEGLYGLADPELAGDEPESWKSRLFEGVSTLLAALTREAPTVICVEDLHWADSASLALLRHILLETGHAALYVCTSRPPFTLLTAAEVESLANVYREIELKDLSASEAQEMMESLLGTTSTPAELRRFVQDKAEGNPFYLEEMVNSLIESDTLARDNGGWRLAGSITEFDIPLTISGVVSARIDRLDGSTKRVLQEASVVGRSFLYDILNRVTTVEDQLDGCLGSLEMTDLVRKRSLQPDLEYVFKHALTQDVAYNSLLRTDRREIHERIGLVIEELFQDRLPEFYETLAFHFKQGRSTEKAIYYLARSGEKSLARYAVAESHRYFKDAFDLLSTQGDATHKKQERLADILIEWALAFYYRGAFRELEELLRSHQDLAESLDDDARRGMFLAWMGIALWYREKFKDSYQYLRRALQLGEESGNQKVIGYTCTHLPYVAADLGYVDEALVFARKGQEAALALESDYFLQLESLASVGYALWARGESKKTLEAGEALLRFGEERSRIRSQVAGNWVMGLGHLAAGDIEAAIQCHKRAVELSRDPFYSQYPKLLLGMSYLSNEQFDEAEVLLQEVASFSAEHGAEAVGRPAQVLMGIVLLSRGRLAQGVKMLEEGQRAWLQNQGRYLYAVSESILGTIFSRFVEGGASVDWPTVIRNIGFVVKNAPFAARKAESHFLRAIEMAKEMGAKGVLGEAYLGLGRLHAARGKTAKAKESLAASVDCFEECEADVFLGQAKEALASLE